MKSDSFSNVYFLNTTFVSTSSFQLMFHPVIIGFGGAVRLSASFVFLDVF